MAAPTVSIIIPTYNGAAFLADSVRSCLAQLYANSEIIVVDDGSTDDGATAGVVRGFGSAVRYLRQANAGTAAARNYGIREANGEAIALLDHDDLFLPDKLEKQIPLLLEPNVGLTYTGMEVFDNASSETTSIYEPREELDVHALLSFVTAPPQTFLFWKSVVDDVGGFDPALSATDDWDFSVRVADKYRVVGLRDPLTRVRGHGQNQGRNLELMYRRCEAVFAKNARVHGDCSACKAAIRRGKATTRNWYYESVRDDAVRAFKDRRYVDAAKLSIKAGRLKPGKLLNLAGGPRYLRRRFGNSSEVIVKEL